MGDIRRLYLMRHAEAEALAGDDTKRPLTPHGSRQAQTMGRWLSANGHLIDMVCRSPYLRARQTSEEVCRCLGPVSRLEFVGLVPSGNPEDVLQQWEQTRLPGGGLPAAALWVTHQPLVGKLCNYFVDGSMGNGCPFAPASIMLLEYEHIGPGCASIVWARDVVDGG